MLGCFEIVHESFLDGKSFKLALNNVGQGTGIQLSLLQIIE